MTCTIIIFHYESLAYLRACVREIQRFSRKDIRVNIIIADQSRDRTISDIVLKEFADKPDITIVQLPAYGSGYSVDYIIRHVPITTEFVCTMDVDTIPIHRNWLYVPIRLIEERDFAFVGVHCEIESAYAHMGEFFCICQHFRVARTEAYKELAVNAGFCKSDNRQALQYANNDWRGWSDDCVIAHWWEDQYCKHNKFTLAVTHFLGVAPLEGRYGRYTDDLVFHMGFSYNWKMVRDGEECMGREFLTWMDRMEKEGLTDKLLSEILSKLIPLEPPVVRLGWDAETKTYYRPNAELVALIDRLKSE